MKARKRLPVLSNRVLGLSRVVASTEVLTQVLEDVENSLATRDFRRDEAVDDLERVYLTLVALGERISAVLARLRAVDIAS